MMILSPKPKPRNRTWLAVSALGLAVAGGAWLWGLPSAAEPFRGPPPLAWRALTTAPPPLKVETIALAAGSAVGTGLPLASCGDVEALHDGCYAVTICPGDPRR